MIINANPKAAISMTKKVANTALKFPFPKITVASTIAVDPMIWRKVAIMDDPWGIKSLVNELAPSVVAGIIANALPASTIIVQIIPTQIFRKPESNSKPPQPMMNKPKPIAITGLKPIRSAKRPLRRFNHDRKAAAGTSAIPDQNGLSPKTCW